MPSMTIVTISFGLSGGGCACSVLLCSSNKRNVDNADDTDWLRRAKGWLRRAKGWLRRAKG